MATSHSTLALHGGEPVHRGEWPSWPVHDEREREALAPRGERDEVGRWGPEDRPISNVVIERIRVHPLAATTGQPATPDA